MKKLAHHSNRAQNVMTSKHDEKWNMYNSVHENEKGRRIYKQ